MKKYLFIYLIIVFLFTLSGCNENTQSTDNHLKDKVSGSYTAYGITGNIDAKVMSKTGITNLKIEFKNGKYSVSYCLDDYLNTTSNCDMVKQEGTGTYTIQDDILHLSLGTSTSTDMQTNQVITVNNNTNRSCKIIEDEQIIIDCRASGGWLYFSKYIDDKYYKKRECTEFDGKTYEGDANYLGYYLRNGTWISSPGVASIKISFKDGELDDYRGNMFKNTGCEKISDTKYKLGIRVATYNKENDSFLVTIGQVDGIDYGTVEFINSTNKRKLIQLPDITVIYVCESETNCYEKANYSLSDMQKFAKENNIKLKIYYTKNSSCKKNSVLSYCYIEDNNKSNDTDCIWTSKPSKVYEGDTIGIEVSK